MVTFLGARRLPGFSNGRGFKRVRQDAIGYWQDVGKALYSGLQEYYNSTTGKYKEYCRGSLEILQEATGHGKELTC